MVFQAGCILNVLVVLWVFVNRLSHLLKKDEMYATLMNTRYLNAPLLQKRVTEMKSPFLAALVKKKRSGLPQWMLNRVVPLSQGKNIG